MDKTKILQDILVLLKAAKEAPEQFQLLIKDDKPHPANSPEDKAHDVKEEDESLKQALAILDTPEKKSKMLEHLRSLQDESDLRSPENQAVGQEPMEKQSNPLFAKEKGVHQPVKAPGLKGGMSSAGVRARIAKEPSIKDRPEVAQESIDEAKTAHKEKLKELKQMPKANLPKSEKDMEKEETKHDRCVEEVSKDPKIKNPHAVCVAAGVEPEKWKKGDKDMNKTEKSALDMAKELLKMAQEKPEQFEELAKTLAPAPAPKPAASPAPKSSMPKPAMPKPPKMQAPGMMKEEKEESKEHEAKESKEHEAKESKEHEAKEKAKEKMEKKAKPMDKCGDMKMSKEEIKADLKKEWQPKFKKKGC